MPFFKLPVSFPIAACRRLAVLLLCCLLTGCGEAPPPLVPVTGKVVLSDGSPVTRGSISFHPDTANSYQKDDPSSLLQVDGSFTMKTFPFGEGVPPGKYKVTLSPDLAGRIRHPEYGLPAKTPWKIEVTEAGVADHTFEVN